MKRLITALGAAVAVLAVAVPLGTADDGRQPGDGGKPKPVVVCAQTSFLVRIVRVGDGTVVVRPGQSESGRALTVTLTDGTVVRQDDVVVDTSALAAGKRVKLLVRACRSGDAKTLTAKVVVILKDVVPGDKKPAPPAGTTPAPADPPKTDQPKPEVCGQGEMDTVLVAVSPTSVTVRTESSEGVKEWPLAITGDTVIRKGDQLVPASALRGGDKVHVVLLRCPVSGTVRALKIGVLQSA